MFQFVGVEGVITPIVDQFPDFLRKGYRREIFTACVCFVEFLVGLPMVCPVRYLLTRSFKFNIHGSKTWSYEECTSGCFKNYNVYSTNECILHMTSYDQVI